LGLGVWRLPPDEAESISIVRYAVDRGINYLDLGCPCDMGWQEKRLRIVSRALKDGYRQKVRLAAALPSWLVSSPRELDYYLKEQLGWLGLEGVDFFLLGGLNRYLWPRLKEMGVLGWVEKAVADGLIGYPGFSFHDHFQVLRGILDDYQDWALAQFQYSYMDEDIQPGASGLKYAADKGLAVIAAEPLLGGRLTREPPEPVAKLWDSAPQKRSLAEWGLRWVWNQPEVAAAVCDMATTEQVTENAALADQSGTDSLTIQEEVLISRVREAYRKLKPIPCAICHGCEPCAQGIDVPRIFELYNDAVMYDDVETARSIYRAERHSIENCTDCGECAGICARSIDIPEWLKKAHRLFTE